MPRRDRSRGDGSSDGVPRAMTCPSSEALCGLVDDTLAAEARVEIENHVDGCDDCRALIAMLARTATGDFERSRRSAPTIADAPANGFESTAIAMTEVVPERPSLRRIADSAPATLE